MNSGFEFVKEIVPDQHAALGLMDRMYDVAQATSVFGAPVSQGEYTAITASEVTIGLGFGYGGGGGSSPAETDQEQQAQDNFGGGGGGGGGGTASGRPVAVIEIGPHGVRVVPIVDPTKIVLALFTAFGAMFMMLSRMRKEAGG